MNDWSTQLWAALIALAGALLVPFVRPLLARRSERARDAGRRRDELCAGLKSQVGILHEELSSDALRQANFAPLRARLQAVKQFEGEFPDRPHLQKSIRLFGHVAGTIVDDKGRFDSPEDRASRLRALTESRDRILGACATMTGRTKRP